MKDRVKNFLVDIITYLSYYLILGFVEWTLDLDKWSPWTRLIFVALVIYNVGKQLNEETE